MASSEHDKRLRAELAAELGWFGLALRGSKALKHTAEFSGKLRPANWGSAGFHERDALNAVAMLVGPIEAEY